MILNLALDFVNFSSYKLYLCVCVSVSVCLSVCPAFKAYISLNIGRILIKLGENVGALIWLIVFKFHKDLISFDVIMTSFLLKKKVISKGSYSAQSQGENSVWRETIMP